MMGILKGFLIDLDGTVYEKDREITGSFNFIKTLDNNQIPYRFVTNTSSLTIVDIQERLSRMGLSVDLKNILNPIMITDLYIKRNNIKSCFFAGTDKIARQLSIPSIDKNQQPEAVILGDMGSVCSYQLLNKVYKYLLEGAELITTSYSDYYLNSSGKNLDTGAFAKFFEENVKCKATILGKPSRLFYQTALFDLGLAAREVIAVGDDISTDIVGAKFQGIFSILVKTGKYHQNKKKQLQVKPDKVIEKLGDLTEIINNYCQSDNSA